MTSQTKINILFLLPFYLFWIIQIMPKTCQLVVYSAWMIAAMGAYILPHIRQVRQTQQVQNEKELSGKYEFRAIDAFTVLQVIYIVLYGISIAVNAPQGHEVSRILAACNTWGITAIALCAYLLYREGHVRLAQIGKIYLVNVLILDAMAMLSLTPLSAIEILGRSLRGFDIVNEVETTRFVGFMEYSNLVVFFVLLMYPAAVEQLRGHVLLSVAFSVVTYGAVLQSNSRTGMIMAPVLIVMYYLSVLYERRVLRIPTRWMVLGVLCLVAVVGTLFHGQILSIVERVYTMRSGSNNSRSIIYTGTLERIWNSPVLGVGIKDAIPETGYEYYYGSHSSYLGAFYKAGIVGGVAYLVSIVALAVRFLRGNTISVVNCDAGGEDSATEQGGALAVTYMISFLLVFALMTLEDLDGADWLIMVVYSLFGICSAKSTSKVV